MRCDLHVHSWHSGAADVPVLGSVGRECYSDPLEVHERALARGMDLVTLTDHDTIDGALSLAHLDDSFVSEEVTLVLEGGRQLHVNVFGIDPRQHGCSPAAATRRRSSPSWPRRASPRPSTTCSRRSPASARSPTSCGRSDGCRSSRR